MTPLMLAIKAGNVEIITVMLDLGCDIHSEAKREKSLIIWAIENEYTALLKVYIYIYIYIYYIYIIESLTSTISSSVLTNKLLVTWYFYCHFYVS